MKKILVTVVALVMVLVPIQSIYAGTSQSCPTSTRLVSQSKVHLVRYTSSNLSREWGAPIIKMVKVPTVNIYNCQKGTWFRVLPKKSQPTPAPGKESSAPTKPAPKPTPKPAPTPTPAPAPEAADFSALQQEMLGYINAERANANLAPLTLDKKLCEGAYLKSRDMAVNNYFSHTSPTYGSPFEMMKSQDITYRTAGENIAKNTSVKGAHTAFMNSEGHRANIMNRNFGKLGLGFYQEGQYLYVTQWFTN